MIEQLRSSLAQHADGVVPLADPYGRLLVRRRRHRRNLSAGLVAFAVLLILPASLVVTRGFGSSPKQTGTPLPGLTGALLDSPTRGSLAGDAAFLAAVKQRAASVTDGPGRTPGVAMPNATDQVRVLFACDAFGYRFAVVAAPGVADAQLWTGPAGASADALRVQDLVPLTPVLRLRLWDQSGQLAGAVLLAPAGSRIRYSDDPRFTADGTVLRTWQEVPDDYLVMDSSELKPTSRVRVDYGSQQLLEGAFGSVPPGGDGSQLPVDRVEGRTTPLAASAEDGTEQILGRWPVPAGSRYRVLWSAQIPMDGVGTAVIATVALLTPDGGGRYATWCFDGDGNARTHPTGEGVIGDPQRSLIAMRLPYFSGTGPTDSLQIIAPTGATRAEVLRDGQVVGGGPLQLGVGAVQLPPTGTGSVTVRAYSAEDTVLAEHTFSDSLLLQGDSYEKDVLGW